LLKKNRVRPFAGEAQDLKETARKKKEVEGGTRLQSNVRHFAIVNFTRRPVNGKRKENAREGREQNHTIFRVYAFSPLYLSPGADGYRERTRSWRGGGAEEESASSSTSVGAYKPKKKLSVALIKGQLAGREEPLKNVPVFILA